MKTYYSAEKNVQILISLMKAHNIKKIVVSPGTTNICFVASVQQDPYFEIYSSVDERSAAYMACGMAAESGESVALSCTGATASRNYLPALTEAFYRKLPILAITSTKSIGSIGQNIDQVIDRTQVLNDIVKKSIQLPIPRTEDEYWECNVSVNTALIELKRHGGGPVHINLTTVYNDDFTIKKLSDERIIKYHTYGEKLPEIPEGRIGIFVGAHKKWDDSLVKLVDEFCERYNAVVLVDQTSNYKGKYGIFFSLIVQQKMVHTMCSEVDLLIHIGDISASAYTRTKKVWRVCRDGEVRDTFKKLTEVFEMDEKDFFELYVEKRKNSESKTLYYSEWKLEYGKYLNKAMEEMQNIPYSNMWVALQLHDKLPANTVLHLGILNSLRCWNMLEIDHRISAFSNTGGFGIDGGMSSLIGASLVCPEKIYIGIVGDLAFFYDLNSLGNRHIGNNIRILLVNNGIGTEFKNNMNLASRAGIGEDTNKFIAAAGHYGNKSKKLVRHYAEDLGFMYMSASNKEEFIKCIPQFVSAEYSEKSIVFEVFTDSIDETMSIEIMQTLETSTVGRAKTLAKSMLGNDGYNKLKNIIRK
jgi:2-succinyl-5-enolpyruvyl-6-hydroxy-3-cyclohexene-1-carboxylate synthase